MDEKRKRSSEGNAQKSSTLYIFIAGLVTGVTLGVLAMYALIFPSANTTNEDTTALECMAPKSAKEGKAASCYQLAQAFRGTIALAKSLERALPSQIQTEAPSAEKLEQNDDEDAYHIAEQRQREREIMLLREALPDNSQLPGAKTPEELDHQTVSIEEQRRIGALIDNNDAAQEDLKRYYDLQAKRFEDEMALVDYCERALSESKEGDDIPYRLCTQITARADQTRMLDRTSLTQLRETLLPDSDRQ